MRLRRHRNLLSLPLYVFMLRCWRIGTTLHLHLHVCFSLGYFTMLYQLQMLCIIKWCVYKNLYIRLSRWFWLIKGRVWVQTISVYLKVLFLRLFGWTEEIDRSLSKDSQIPTNIWNEYLRNQRHLLITYCNRTSPLGPFEAIVAIIYIFYHRDESFHSFPQLLIKIKIRQKNTSTWSENFKLYDGILKSRDIIRNSCHEVTQGFTQSFV